MASNTTITIEIVAKTVKEVLSSLNKDRLLDEHRVRQQLIDVAESYIQSSIAGSDPTAVLDVLFQMPASSRTAHEALPIIACAFLYTMPVVDELITDNGDASAPVPLTPTARTTIESLSKYVSTAKRAASALDAPHTPLILLLLGIILMSAEQRDDTLSLVTSGYDLLEIAIAAGALKILLPAASNSGPVAPQFLRFLRLALLSFDIESIPQWPVWVASFAAVVPADPTGTVATSSLFSDTMNVCWSVYPQDPAPVCRMVAAALSAAATAADVEALLTRLDAVETLTVQFTPSSPARPVISTASESEVVSGAEQRIAGIDVPEGCVGVVSDGSADFDHDQAKNITWHVPHSFWSALASSWAAHPVPVAIVLHALASSQLARRSLLYRVADKLTGHPDVGIVMTRLASQAAESSDNELRAAALNALASLAQREPLVAHNRLSQTAYMRSLSAAFRDHRCPASVRQSFVRLVGAVIPYTAVSPASQAPSLSVSARVMSQTVLGSFHQRQTMRETQSRLGAQSGVNSTLRRSQSVILGNSSANDHWIPAMRAMLGMLVDFGKAITAIAPPPAQVKVLKAIVDLIRQSTTHVGDMPSPQSRLTSTMLTDPGLIISLIHLSLLTPTTSEDTAFIVSCLDLLTALAWCSEGSPVPAVVGTHSFQVGHAKGPVTAVVALLETAYATPSQEIAQSVLGLLNACVSTGSGLQGITRAACLTLSMLLESLVEKGSPLIADALALIARLTAHAPAVTANLLLVTGPIPDHHKETFGTGAMSKSMPVVVASVYTVLAKADQFVLDSSEDRTALAAAFALALALRFLDTIQGRPKLSKLGDILVKLIKTHADHKPSDSGIVSDSILRADMSVSAAVTLRSAMLFVIKARQANHDASAVITALATSHRIVENLKPGNPDPTANLFAALCLQKGVAPAVFRTHPATATGLLSEEYLDGVIHLPSAAMAFSLESDGELDSGSAFPPGDIPDEFDMTVEDYLDAALDVRGMFAPRDTDLLASKTLAQSAMTFAAVNGIDPTHAARLLTYVASFTNLRRYTAVAYADLVSSVSSAMHMAVVSSPSSVDEQAAASLVAASCRFAQYIAQSRPDVSADSRLAALDFGPAWVESSGVASLVGTIQPISAAICATTKRATAPEAADPLVSTARSIVSISLDHITSALVEMLLFPASSIAAQLKKLKKTIPDSTAESIVVVLRTLVEAIGEVDEVDRVVLMSASQNALAIAHAGVVSPDLLGPISNLIALQPESKIVSLALSLLYELVAPSRMGVIVACLEAISAQHLEADKLDIAAQSLLIIERARQTGHELDEASVRVIVSIAADLTAEMAKGPSTRASKSLRTAISLLLPLLAVLSNQVVQSVYSTEMRRSVDSLYNAVLKAVLGDPGKWLGDRGEALELVKTWCKGQSES
ncbi:hypothetical protein J8273_2113 [Carpediemonas membranifera]|uniref:Uncharacterized protein n=1 Tax=Carpediemonas membranifera TaxID=201153 RepID=A0A8J6E5W1_9EUKA|nr:hypothetical protein J8273_2113 [Carpediemonas membranifera]|eukprot:KAG9396382.1 hypothetical protein J8273_2113 [Carpediemonas membranifera]